jgi:hypothetical protein
MSRIVLEDTLSDFFAAEDARTSNGDDRNIESAQKTSRKICIFQFPTNAANRRYIFQDSRTTPTVSSAISGLILSPQRQAWMLGGDLSVIFIADEGIPDRSTWERAEADLEDTLQVISPSTRYKAFFSHSSTSLAELVGDATVIPLLPSDDFVSFKHHVDPDTHYDVLSKRAIAFSGLPTPAARLIDFAPTPDTSIDAVITSALSTVQAQTIPFVLKLNSTWGSLGVYVIDSETSLAAAIKDVEPLLRDSLPSLNATNAHLHPFTLVLMDYVSGPCSAVNFYVRGDGTAKFSSATTQIFEDEMWSGGYIEYSAQSDFAKTYDAVLQQTAHYLMSRGYSGPCGVDIITDEGGKHHVIDINARPTGTFVLGCLRKHFVDGLGIGFASLMICIEFRGTMLSFRKRFKENLGKGLTIVLAWHEDMERGKAYASLVIGAESKNDLQDRVKQVEDWANQVGGEIFSEQP